MTDNRTSKPNQNETKSGQGFCFTESQVEAAAKAAYEYAQENATVPMPRREWESLGWIERGLFEGEVRAALVAAQGAAPQTQSVPGKRLSPEFRADLVEAARERIQAVWADVPEGVDAKTLAQNVVSAQEFFWLAHAFPVLPSSGVDEDDREAKAEALKEWQSSNEIRRYSEFYTSWEDGYDAGFSRAAVPDAQAERVSMEVLDEYLRIAAWLETQAALRGATGDTMHGLAAEALATLIDHEYSRHTIPLYGMLDVWMALHGTSHPDFDEFYDEHGYAEAWSRLMAEIRSRAAVPDAATDARERLHAKCDCVPDLGPAHCHLCSADGSPVEWANCVAVQQVTDAPETVEVAFKTVEVERLGHLLVQLSPATPRNGAATVRRLMEEMNIKEVGQ